MLCDHEPASADDCLFFCENYKCACSCPLLKDCSKTQALPKGMLMVVDPQGNFRNVTNSISVHTSWLPPDF